MASKRCNKCGTTKPLAEFGRDQRQKDFKSLYCKECVRADRRRRYREQNGIDTVRRAHFMRAYGMTLEDYDAMLAAQGGVCAICGHAPDPTRRGLANRLHVDHCHKTGRVRALLCHACNQGLGHFRENPRLLIQAIAYLADV